MIFCAINVQCDNAERFNSDFNLFKQNLFSMRDHDVSKIISEIVFSNWTDNYHCSTELNAIKSALTNSEEWAFKSKLDVFVIFA